jgi:FkbH-like protein
LINKTNQFNLTTRRYTSAEVCGIMNDPAKIHFSLRLKDRYADHGLVGVLVASVHNSAASVDLWLMSCRVIGRTVENAMLQHLSRRAIASGCNLLRGTYIPSQKNGLVKNLYATLGFRLVEDREALSTWEYDLAANSKIAGTYMQIEEEVPR